ncbi:hypothetical protein FKM82_019407 [Ascaphus truei]
MAAVRALRITYRSLGRTVRSHIKCALLYTHRAAEHVTVSCCLQSVCGSSALAVGFRR